MHTEEPSEPDESPTLRSDPRGWLRENSRVKKIRVDHTRPEPVTGEQLRAKTKAKWARFQASRKRRSSEEKAALGRRVTIGAVGVLTVGTIVIGSVAENGYRASQGETAEKIESLQTQITEAQEDVDAAPSADDLVRLSDKASRAAKTVAADQQKFAQLIDAAQKSKGPQNGAPSKEMNAVAEHRKALAKNFTDTSFVVDDEEAYQWSTAVSHEPDEIDPRYPWYIRYDGDRASGAKASTWEVASVTPKIDGSGASVLFTCTDTTTGDLLAWASSDYDAQAEAFTDLEVKRTALGQDHSVTDGGDSAGTKPKKKDEKKKKSDDKDSKSEKGKDKS